MHKQEIVHSIWNVYDEHMASKSSEDNAAFITQMVANLLCPGPTYFYIFAIGLREFPFVSPGISTVLGISPDHLAHVDDFLERVHPDDLPFMAECEDAICHFLFKKVPLNKMKKYKFSYPIRMRHEDGSYRLILHQALTIAQDGFGRMTKTIGIDSDVGHLVPTVNRRLSIIGLEGEPSYLSIDVGKPDKLDFRQVKKTFSERELQVIRLFAEGYTAEGVAQTLYLSTGTVRTHRRNVLKKSGCPNMTALVAMCIREGWL